MIKPNIPGVDATDGELIAIALDDFRWLCGEEQRIVQAVNPREERLLRIRFEQWAQNTHQLLPKLHAQGGQHSGPHELEEAYGRVRAHLAVTPEQLRQARTDLQQGKAVPAQELRDELRSRVRA